MHLFGWIFTPFYRKYLQNQHLWGKNRFIFLFSDKILVFLKFGMPFATRARSFFIAHTDHPNRTLTEQNKKHFIPINPCQIGG